ncbi:hypothetical protein C8J57DRAFT_1220256 [Mycena rebaudengoi]|nr:hypothetical protein C8J57DRAFT_1220256 [Mycena rebaudengoi]
MYRPFHQFRINQMVQTYGVYAPSMHRDSMVHYLKDSTRADWLLNQSRLPRLQEPVKPVFLSFPAFHPLTPSDCSHNASIEPDFQVTPRRLTAQINAIQPFKRRLTYSLHDLACKCTRQCSEVQRLKTSHLCADLPPRRTNYSRWTWTGPKIIQDDEGNPRFMHVHHVKSFQPGSL